MVTLTPTSCCRLPDFVERRLGEGERGRKEGGLEKERVCVCACVNGFIVDSSPPPPANPHLPSVYLALRAKNKVRHFINIHLHCSTVNAPSLSPNGNSFCSNKNRERDRERERERVFHLMKFALGMYYVMQTYLAS